MEECESLDSEMTELQELQCGASDVISQDDEDEVEELHNSLREVVQDPSVKPKLQCLMVDPSFSMVTVQSEDSGIVWETASSRCSTPWASETSSLSEVCSMEGSGAAGKITIVFDEEKIIRKRIRSGGRSSRLGDRLSRPSSSRSASALGVERPEMAEVSLPNVKQEKPDTEPDLEEIRNKDQQLFSLISEGYEILNIRVPSKLPTVDEEESTELQDNLSYLDQTPKIRSRNHHTCIEPQDHVLPQDVEILDSQEPSKQDSSQSSVDTELRNTPNNSDIDYFEKFTLLDEVVPVEKTPELRKEVEQSAAKSQVEEQKPAKETATGSPSVSEDSFVFVTDVEIVGDHLDEVFYGNGAPADALQQRENDEAENGAGMRARRESQRSMKESGSVLFGSEETILTPIFISPGPPKIIDPILLEEPTAMSFMYSDLYEDAIGERRKSDEEYSEAESIASAKSFKRCLSDSEEEGYLEKFILKDETPTVEVQESAEEEGRMREGRMMWSQNNFEMTGCLTRVVEEEDENKMKKEKPKAQEVSAEEMREDLQERWEIVAETEKEREEIQLFTATEEQVVRQASEESIQRSKLMEKKMQDHEVKHEVKDQTEPPEKCTDELPPETQQVDKKTEKTEESEEHQREEPAEKASEEATAVKSPEIQTETTENSFFEEAATDIEMVTPAKVKELTVKQEMLGCLTRVLEEEDRDKMKNEEPKAQEVSTEEMREDLQERWGIVTETEKEREEIQLSTATEEQAAKQASEESTQESKPMKEKMQDQEMKHEVETDQTESPGSLTDELPPETQQVETEKTEESEEHHREEPAEKASEQSIIEIETSTQTSLCGEKAPPVEVITDCESAVHAAVKVTEKTVNEKEIHTKVQVDLQEVTSAEATGVQTAVPGGEIRQEALIEKIVVESPKFVPKADEESEIKTKMSREVTEPLMPDKVMTDSGRKWHEIHETEKHQQEDLAVCSETEKTKLTAEVRAKTPTENTGTAVQDLVDVSDELILLVPKGQAVEMDIKIGQWSEKITKSDLSELDNTCQQQIASENTTTDSEAAMEEIVTEPQLEEEPDFALKQEALLRNELDRYYSPVTPVEEADTEEQKTDKDLKEDKGIFSPLRSFIPQEDLSELYREDVQSEAAEIEQKAEMHKVEEAPEINVMTQYLHREYEEVTEEVTVGEPEYEMISKQEAREITDPEIQRDAEESRPESGQEREERMEMKEETEKEQKVFDLSAEEELIEDDYDIIDAEEESQARLAAELQGMDWFCLTCERLLSKDDYESGEHHSHQVTDVNEAYEEIKERLSDWISELQGRSENIEDLVSELELAYNSVEDQCVETEVAMQVQNEEMMALVMEQYNNMSVNMEEEKKAKLEQLYDQIVSFQEGIDSAKATLETTAREAETDARSLEDIHARLKAALDSAMSLELGPKGLLVFEDYAKGNASSSNLAQRKGIPVPQRPTLQPQEPGSASSTNVTVYWKVNQGDIIDCFQVYCMEDPQGAVSEEYRVTVKESYCVLEELEPDKTYKVWVMAVNYTGCSLPSERLAFRTAPSVPVIETERCTVMWDSATLRWSSEKQTGQSYTLEYCRQYELEGEGLRSISGIKSCEHRVHLQPNENYLFYIKAVNEAGVSEQSEAALISTKGTRFHLLKASAHPALELSADQTTLHYSQYAHEHVDKQCPSILGELLPARGHYYWETIVSGSTAYRLGVAYSTANKNSPLGENSLSWGLQCIPAPSGCRYQFLHNDVQSSVFVMDSPERVGTLLDYQLGRLSFYNAQSGQLLGAFNQRFTQLCHPALALEMPGYLEVSMVPEVPEFAKEN
ncbi:hypothetical protein PAMP_022417 [Pampus punctatissimus]